MGFSSPVTLALWESLSVDGKHRALRRMTVFLSDRDLKECLKYLNQENSRNADYVLGLWTSLGFTDRYGHHMHRVITEILEEEDDC